MKRKEFDDFKRADPLRFGELLERAGYIGEAISVYRDMSHVPSKIYRAAELALQMSDYALARQLISQTKMAIASALNDAPPYDCESMGEGIARSSQYESAKRIAVSIETLEDKLRTLTRKRK